MVVYACVGTVKRERLPRSGRRDAKLHVGAPAAAVVHRWGCWAGGHVLPTALMCTSAITPPCCVQEVPDAEISGGPDVGRELRQAAAEGGGGHSGAAAGISPPHDGIGSFDLGKARADIK